MIAADLLRRKYIDFFVARDHRQIPSAPLVPENDPTTLFTSSGMQPLIPYLLGQPHPLGNRLVNSQRSFRAQDIDEVGDSHHTTYFEMLGNWSLGDYFKKEQLSWFYEFLTKELDLPKNRLYISVFEGNTSVPKDTESYAIWKKLGIPENHLFFYGVDKNWWSRSGEPGKMPPGEPGGPDSEVFYDFGPKLRLHEKSQWKDKTCHPNCDCGRFLEIGNSVFMEYQKQTDGSLQELPHKNVDFGGGLERTLAAVQNTPDIFETDLFSPIVDKIQELSGISYSSEIFKANFRIISDHIKAATFMVSEGVVPSNKKQGYILRRLIRRSIVKFYQLTRQVKSAGDFDLLIKEVIGLYPEYFNNIEVHTSVISEEVDKFSRVFIKGYKLLEKIPPEKIDAKHAFDIYQTYGFPYEIIQEILVQKGKSFLSRKDFDKEAERHALASRTASAGMFKGGLEDQSEITTKYHTATHLLHRVLRQVLGDHVQQKGSNITADRLRFDFSHPEKLTPGQLQEIEAMINQKIEANLPVTREEKPKQEALVEGALAFFAQKYPDVVSVYTIGPADHWFSKEICGGPHVNSTAEIGRIKIIKEESAGAGIRRIYARIISLTD
jgi:alanyl-tRNA synthetase